MQIELSPAEAAKLAAIAAARGFDRVEEYASALLQRAARTETVPSGTPNSSVLTAFDIAQQMGLIAMSDDGPADLATNPAHLEGFGKDDTHNGPH